MSYMKYGDASLYHGRARHHQQKIVTIEVGKLLGETEKAYLIDSGETDKKGKAIGKWVPKSISEYDPDDGMLQIEEWFAHKERLI